MPETRDSDVGHTALPHDPEVRAALAERVEATKRLATDLAITFEKAVEIAVPRTTALRKETIEAVIALRNEQHAQDVGSRAYAESRIDEVVPLIAEAMEMWLSRDREDWRSSSRAAARLQLHMRTVSSWAAQIAAIDSRDRWWGVNARREC